MGRPRRGAALHRLGPVGGEDEVVPPHLGRLLQQRPVVQLEVGGLRKVNTGFLEGSPVAVQLRAGGPRRRGLARGRARARPRIGSGGTTGAARAARRSAGSRGQRRCQPRRGGRRRPSSWGRAEASLPPGPPAAPSARSRPRASRRLVAHMGVKTRALRLDAAPRASRVTASQQPPPGHCRCERPRVARPRKVERAPAGVEGAVGHLRGGSATLDGPGRRARRRATSSAEDGC